MAKKADTLTLPNGLSPQQWMAQLCNFTPETTVAFLTEISPGAEYFSHDHMGVAIQFLGGIPELTHVFVDGFTSPHRPGILNNNVVFYNRTTEEMLKHMRGIKKSKHVHWMFNQLMDMLDAWFADLRAGLPEHVEILYSPDSDDLHGAIERMLRVLVQTATLKWQKIAEELSGTYKDHRRLIHGIGNGNAKEERAALKELEERFKVLKEEFSTKETAAKTAAKELEAAQKAFEKAKGAERDKLRKTVQRREADKVKADDEFAEAKKSVQPKMKRLEKAVASKREDIEHTEKGARVRLASLKQRRELLAGKRGKQKERDQLDTEIKSLREKIKAAETDMANVDAELKEVKKELGNLRDPETSPHYQRRVDTHVRDMWKRIRALCEKHGITLVNGPRLVKMGSIVMSYAHHRGRTWSPKHNDAKRIAEKHHAQIESLHAEARAQFPGHHGVDIVAVGGHEGVGMVRWQRDGITPDEARMRHVNTFFDPNTCGVNQTVYAAFPPFEDAKAIDKYLNRRKPARTRGGLPQNSASHPVFIRHDQGAVTGMIIMRKHVNRVMSAEFFDYDLFATGEVLEPFVGVAVSSVSDEHVGSPEQDVLAIFGRLAMLEQLMEAPLTIHGTEVYVGSVHNIGDIAEANSAAWKEGHKFRDSVYQAAQELADGILGVDQTDFESVFRKMLAEGDQLLGGSNENMRIMQEMVGYLARRAILTVFHRSPQRLRDIAVLLEGNHFANAVRAHGISELDELLAWVRSLIELQEHFPEADVILPRFEVIRGGVPSAMNRLTSEDPDTVIHMGGYSTARQAFVEKFGVGADGQLEVAKLMRVAFTHEPNAMERKAHNVNADVMKAGHTHESVKRMVKRGHNRSRMLDIVPTGQRVSATEVEKGGTPRTRGTDLTIHSRPGHYWATTIDSDKLRQMGACYFMQLAQEAIKAAQKRKA